mmetsp:Transcript_140544/g.365687  ORF Transcript_140544/g.365687 Transcript_140544/m.365687 type:complete len:213 (-) Transcript_140544:40-678(-)
MAPRASLRSIRARSPTSTPTARWPPPPRPRQAEEVEEEASSSAKLRGGPTSRASRRARPTSPSRRWPSSWCAPPGPSSEACSGSPTASSGRRRQISGATTTSATTPRPVSGCFAGMRTGDGDWPVRRMSRIPGPRTRAATTRAPGRSRSADRLREVCGGQQQRRRRAWIPTAWAALERASADDDRRMSGFPSTRARAVRETACEALGNVACS